MSKVRNLKSPTKTMGATIYSNRVYDIYYSLLSYYSIYIHQDGCFFRLTQINANRVAVLDISDLNHIKRLEDPNEDPSTVGPHYVKVTPDYFVQTGKIGIINTSGDFRALYTDINNDGSSSFNRSINLAKKLSVAALLCLILVSS
ncbi:hypothetical protein N7523_000285 [Penicillium sp. IBT 18751x]|nr:hypothetical protein N7523_000285 [Penicillium sp. IBT 18751x]